MRMLFVAGNKRQGRTPFPRLGTRERAKQDIPPQMRAFRPRARPGNGQVQRFPSLFPFTTNNS